MNQDVHHAMSRTPVEVALGLSSGILRKPATSLLVGTKNPDARTNLARTTIKPSNGGERKEPDKCWRH